MAVWNPLPPFVASWVVVTFLFFLASYGAQSARAELSKRGVPRWKALVIAGVRLSLLRVAVGAFVPGGQIIVLILVLEAPLLLAVLAPAAGLAFLALLFLHPNKSEALDVKTRFVTCMAGALPVAVLMALLSVPLSLA